MSGSSENRQDSSVRTDGLSGKPITIPLRQEEVSVDVRTVDTGKGIRVEKHVREEPRVIDEIVRDITEMSSYATACWESFTTTLAE